MFYCISDVLTYRCTGVESRVFCITTHPPPTAVCKLNFWLNNRVTVILHPPYSPDLAPADFFRFLATKKSSKAHGLQTYQTFEDAWHLRFGRSKKRPFLFHCSSFISDVIVANGCYLRVIKDILFPYFVLFVLCFHSSNFLDSHCITSIIINYFKSSTCNW